MLSRAGLGSSRESKVMGQQQAISGKKCVGGIELDGFPYPTHDIIKVCQMSLTSLATKDLVGSQVNVV